MPLEDQSQSLAQEENEVTAIMTGENKVQHDLWQRGDQRIAKRISDFFTKKYPGDAPAGTPQQQTEVLEAKPETMEPEAQYFADDQRNLAILQHRWGNSYQENADHVNRVFEAVQSGEIVQIVDSRRLGANPDFLDWLASGRKFFT